MEGGNITSSRSNFCLEGLVTPDGRPRRNGYVKKGYVKKGERLYYKDLGMRPPCPVCGGTPTSWSKYWRCSKCKKLYKKITVSRDNSPYELRPFCLQCNKVFTSNGSTWRCTGCGREVVKHHTPREPDSIKPPCEICGGKMRKNDLRYFGCTVCGHTQRRHPLKNGGMGSVRRNNRAKAVQSTDLAERLKSFYPEGGKILLLGGCKIS